MGDEWLDPSGREADLRDVVLRRRHEASYAFARGLAEGELVVDVACGVGYGARVLGGRPSRYLGVDRALPAVREAASRHSTDVATFACADVLEGLPVGTGRAGLVLAFQIIEHVPARRTRAFLRELRRICRPDGRVVFTTPNRVHRLLPFQPPWNPYHEREFDRRELAAVLRADFRDVSMRGLRADGPIERVERDRVRQDPLWVYSRPLFRVLPAALAAWLERRLFPERAEGRAAPGPAEGVGEVTLDRFRVEEDPGGEGLDLVALCRP